VVVNKLKLHIYCEPFLKEDMKSSRIFDSSDILSKKYYFFKLVTKFPFLNSFQDFLGNLHGTKMQYLFMAV